MSLVAARRLLLLASALALAACSKPADAPSARSEAATQPAGLTPTRAEVERFLAEGSEPSLQALRPLDYWLHYKVLHAAGAEQALGGEAQTVAALQALAEDYERKARGAQAQVPRMVPAAFTGEGMSSGFLGLGLGSFGGLLTGGMISSVVSEMSDEQLAEAAKNGFGRTQDKDGSFEVRVGEDGSLTQAFEFDGKVDDGLTGKVKLKMKVDACPDASGKVKVESDIDSSVRVSGKAGTGGYVRSHFVYERWLDDDANLIDGPDGSSSSMRIDMGGFENYESQHVQLTTGWSRGGSETFENRGESGYSIFRMDEVERTQKLVQGAQLIQTLMAEVMLRGMKQAPWESGRCVRLDVGSDPARRKGARPSTRFQVTARPRAKSDGAQTGGSVRAALSGGDSLAREGEKVPADAQYGYTAPAKKDESASIAFEARSKRGVGRATLEFDTKQKRAYTAVGGAGEFRGSGKICDLGEAFTISGSGVTMTFTPSSDTGGSYRYEGRMSGFAVHGDGTYTVSADDSGGTLVGTGPGCVNARGEHCAVDSEHYTLTPAEPCD
ncbi:hypothetical protein [Pseudoxanthomonas suwonensis]|uniref:Secreted protein n=1 Tax=Pseudoxanthomonas suwonensis TaxID=314722 RepID=A0A0E3Z1B0_9GAMM|nr:hypothetical protein [Pseudoxanthomonas suwonensis]AKC86973.1 hypothetical protein WQ53_09635 [Pseudoxanthomonas suwonensis]